AKTATAVRSAGMTDLHGYANRVYASAYASGAMTTPERHMKEAEKHTTLLREIRDGLRRGRDGPGPGGTRDPAAPAGMGGLTHHGFLWYLKDALSHPVDSIRAAWARH